MGRIKSQGKNVNQLKEKLLIEWNNITSDIEKLKLNPCLID